jgi:hypothetical protein
MEEATNITLKIVDNAYSKLRIKFFIQLGIGIFFLILFLLLLTLIRVNSKLLKAKEEHLNKYDWKV